MGLNVINSTNLQVLEETLNFTQARHEILAGNIANLDTPGYRVRDLSVENFQHHLKEAISRPAASTQHLSPGITETPPRSGSYDDRMREVRDSMKTILFHDDSNVGLEQQVTEISKNQFMHNMAVSILNHQYRLLETAISERV